MRRRLLALLLLLYVGADFSNPMMPGAVSFDPTDSVDGIRARAAVAALAPPVAAGPVCLMVEPAPAPAPSTRDWLTPLARAPIARPAHLDTGESPPPTEDH